jgi:uncharacterized protein YjbI with pentapeptide repeats
VIADPRGGARMSAASGSGGWTAEEQELRRVEVAAQRRASLWQCVGAVVAAVATFAAAFAAYQTAEAVKVARDGISRQVDEDRLSSALDAIGGDEAAQRIAGITLLRRNVVERLDRAGAGAAVEGDRRDAYGLFSASLLIVQNYLRSAEVSSARPGIAAGEGYGFPKLESDTVYAARELQLLLTMKDKVANLADRKPGVDLSHVVLYGQSWRNVDFSWVDHFSRGLDLRGANLQGSRWGTSYLGYSFLQCADLSSSVFGLAKPGGGFANASLVSADLRGANLTGAQLHADMTNARLDGANLAGADFTNANLNGVDLSATVNLEDAIGLDRAMYYKPRAPRSLPKQARKTPCLENPNFSNPPPSATVAAQTG